MQQLNDDDATEVCWSLITRPSPFLLSLSNKTARSYCSSLQEGSTSEYTEQDSEPQWAQDDNTGAGTRGMPACKQPAYVWQSQYTVLKHKLCTDFALPAQDQSSSGTGEKPIILITTVDIGEGRTDQITLREGDSPQVQ